MTQSLLLLHARILDCLQRGRSVLVAWAQPEENPFLQRALRVEARKHKPLFTVTVVSLLSFLSCWLIWYLWQLLLFNIELAVPGSWSDLRLRQLQQFLASAFGENPISWFALATAWTSGLGVLWSTRARAAYLLRQELIKNTLIQLQQLPIAEERWIWFMSAHPAFLSLLIWLCGLPMYALAVFTGQWSALDAIGLLILFLLLGHAVPLWMPAVWQQQNAKSTPKLTWQQWQAMVKEQQAAAQAGDVTTHLESQRRLQRMLGGLEQEYSTSEDTDRKPLIVIGNPQRGSANGFISVVAFIGLAQVAAGLGISLFDQLRDLWPLEITSLLPAIPLTWPLISARLLFAPLPFFSFLFSPILLIVPLWLAVSHQKFVGLASQVSAAETFWTKPRVERSSTLSWLIGVLSLLLVFGYTWPILVENGELARLIRGALTTPAWALAAGWTLAVVAATILAGIAQEMPFKRAQNRGISLLEAWVESTRSIRRTLVFAITMYFVMCWLGGKSGVNSIWLARLPVVLMASAGFLLADFGSAALGATFSPNARRSWGVLRFVWFQGIGLVALALVARGFFLRKPFSFDDAPFVLLSPFVTVISLFRTGAAQPFSAQPFLWYSLLLQVLAGTAFIVVARRAVLTAASNDATIHEASTPLAVDDQGETKSVRVTALSRLVGVVSWPLDVATRFVERAANWVGLRHEALLRAGEKIGNPVLTYELRRRIRKENWIWQWLALLFGEAILFCLIAQPWQLWTAGPAGAFGIASAATFADWGGAVTGAVLFVTALIGVLACLTIGRAFDADRANGTMVFLFLTPQTDRAILIGKWLTGMIYVTGVLSTGFIWLLAGVLAATVVGKFSLTAVLALFWGFAVGVLIVFASLTNLFFASRARKPTEGAGWALLTCIAVEITFALYCVYAALQMPPDLLRLLPNEIIACIIAAASMLIHGVLAVVMWRLSLRIFARRRYGDIESSGKGAS